MIARNRAPGLDRSFSAQRWAWLPSRLWLEEADRAYAPEALFGTCRMGKHVRKIGQGVFSDEMLHMVLEELST